MRKTTLLMFLMIAIGFSPIAIAQDMSGMDHSKMNMPSTAPAPSNAQKKSSKKAKRTAAKKNGAVANQTSSQRILK